MKMFLIRADVDIFPKRDHIDGVFWRIFDEEMCITLNSLVLPSDFNFFSNLV